MNPKITPDHLARGAVVYVRQSTMGQVAENTESQRHQYALAVSVCKIEWRPAAYHTVLQILRHPIYAGAYVFGRTCDRTRVVSGRARKTTGHSKPMTAWNVLLRDHHPGYISWEQFEANQ